MFADLAQAKSVRKLRHLTATSAFGAYLVMTVYNYKLLLAQIFESGDDICQDIEKHEEQGWEFISGNSTMEIEDGHSAGITFVALMRKPK